VVGSLPHVSGGDEQNGRRSLVVGCNQVAADGMKVITRSETVHKVRSAVLEFYLQHHPLDCPFATTPASATANY